MTSSSSRQLTFVFVAVLVPAAATLVWLGMRLVDQDRALWAQRAVERQDAAADALVRSLSQQLTDVERRLVDGQSVAGAALMTRTSKGLFVVPASMLAWVSGSPRLPEANPRLFEAAEALEFRAGDGVEALPSYRRLAGSADPATRAAALLRSARVHLKGGRPDAALAEYRTLSTLDSVAVAGLPADLVARRALCGILETRGPPEDFRREILALESDFLRGRWALDRDGWDLVATDLGERLKHPVAVAESRLALSRAADWFLKETPASSGRYLVGEGQSAVTVVWRERGVETRAVAVPQPTFASWLAAARPRPDDGFHLALLGPAGNRLAGDAVMGRGRLSRRSAADTGLPWTIMLGDTGSGANRDELQPRLRLFAAGLAALGVLLAGGAFLLWRLVQRELAVARLQAEFVSTVSHEFRTPVTSLRHMIELLQEDDELPRERRQSFYDVLARSTERLHRLVESLLDFGRMEEGRKPYDLRPIDPADVVSSVVRDFARDPASHGVAIDVALDPRAPRAVQADREALGHALWNLLDNAVKYSPGASKVTVRVDPHPAGAAIAVCDTGLGIPRAEHGGIFQKFVRGAQAHRLGIKGTGVGLAIVSHIMRAHGGAVELESEEGKGSTFRLVVPAVP